MITSGVIKVDKGTSVRDFLSTLDREAGNSNTVENSEVIKNEIYKLADRVRNCVLIRTSNGIYLNIGKDEYIEDSKPVKIENDGLTAEFTTTKDNMTFTIKDTLGNTERGIIFFNNNSVDDKSVTQELESLTKLYIYLLQIKDKETIKDEINDIESRLSNLLIMSKSNIFDITTGDIDRVKHFVNGKTRELIESIIK